MSLPAPPTGGLVTASSAPTAGIRISLPVLFEMANARLSSSNFYYESTASGVLWFTGSSSSSSFYYLFISESIFNEKCIIYPITSSLFTTASINPCSFSFIPGSSSFTGGFTPPISGACF